MSCPAVVNSNQWATSVSMSIDSLPLGDGRGCITLTVVEPAGTDEVVTFSITPFVGTAIAKTVFAQTFSVLPVSSMSHCSLLL